MKRLSLLHRFYSTLRGEKLFSSSPGPRVSNSRQVVDLPILHFAEPDSFTFEPLVLDVSHLGIGFRLKRWGSTESGRCNFLSMCHVSPAFDSPSRCIQVDQRDLVRSKVMPDPSVSDEGRQEVRLIRHQELYPEPDRELWFHHTTKEAVAIDALGPNAVMDSWQGPRRSYQVVRSFLGGVELVAVLSAMDGQEALSLLKRLVPIVADSPLARWHDAQQEAYMHLLETL